VYVPSLEPVVLMTTLVSKAFEYRGARPLRVKVNDGLLRLVFARSPVLCVIPHDGKVRKPVGVVVVVGKRSEAGALNL
jgi:hypothetical protein